MTGTAIPRGFVGWTGRSLHPPVLPARCSPIWTTPRPLWTVGDWEPYKARVVIKPPARAAFLGMCLATEDEIHDGMRSATSGTRLGALQELAGSYAVVFDDGHAVHVLTDLAGLHPVFQTRFGDGIMFASDALILAALHHRNLGEAVNPQSVAAGLFLPDLPEPFGTTSVFRSIERTGPGHALAALPESHSVRRLPSRAGHAKPDEASSRLRVTLLRAVRRRVAGVTNLSVDLSGGLDSSTLAVLAAQAGGTPVAVTYADPDAANEDDVHFARIIAATEPRLHHIVTCGDAGTLPFTALDTTPMTDEPSLDVVIAARTRHRLNPALTHQSQCHLTGDGGDVVLTAPGLTYLGDLARARRRKTFRHEASGWAQLRHHPARHVRRAAIALARTSWPETLRQMAEDLADPNPVTHARRPLSDHLAWATWSAAASWGTLRTRRALAACLHTAAAAPHAGDIRPDSADAVALRAVHWHGAVTRGFTQIARGLGIPVQTPFLDNQVVSACLAATAVDRTTVDRAKPLLAAAVGDLMPLSLLGRHTKGDYTSCEYRGLRANADALRTLLATPLLADLGVLNPTGPREALRLGLAGTSVPMGALGAVIATETWLRALESLDPTGWWQPHIPQEEPP